LVIIKHDLLQLLRTILATGRFKIAIVVIVECSKTNENGEIDDILFVPFRSDSFTTHPEDDLELYIHDSFNSIDVKMDNFHEHGSFWKVERILYIRVEHLNALL
jgi:hypothetical protein